MRLTQRGGRGCGVVEKLHHVTSDLVRQGSTGCGGCLAGGPAGQKARTVLNAADSAYETARARAAAARTACAAVARSSRRGGCAARPGLATCVVIALTHAREGANPGSIVTAPRSRLCIGTRSAHRR